MKIRTLVVDDELPARRRLLSLLKTDPEIEIIGQCGDGASAIDAIVTDRPDLLFLDVQMPETDAFGVISAIAGIHMPAIVFVTAYDRYAVQAFDARAVDYLLKPFKRERFFDALQRAKESLHRAVNGDGGYERNLVDMVRGMRPMEDRLVIRSAGRITFLRTADVQWIEAAGNYVRVHAGNEVHTMREKISTLEEQLDQRQFLRIHRSVVVNLDEVKELQPCGGGEYIVLMRDGKELPFGRTHLRQLESLLMAANTRSSFR
jgi:two-component system, LytTR family, response regulator